jgi:dihydroorotate dehydrogenase
MALNGLASLNNMVSYGFFRLINTLGVAVPTHQRRPLGDEGKQAKSHRGMSGPPPYPLALRLFANKGLAAAKALIGSRKLISKDDAAMNS